MPPLSPPVANVVFDIGNVLIHWDPLRLYTRVFGNRADAERFLSEICTAPWNQEMDRGQLESEAVAERITLFPEWADEIRAWDTDWHEMVAGAIDGSVAILETLRRRGVPDYAISNFAPTRFTETLVRFPFLNGFRDTVVSAQVGLVKPDPAIFRLFLDRNGLTAESCLFVDDVVANVEAARSVGMRAVRFTTPEAFAADLAAHGIALD